MRPLVLKMQAFSTYLNETIIDFKGLNEKGLYLISGDTGAGKTTIFDAISYALYGETSGSDRSNDVFRSSYANYDQPTRIAFDFELQGKVYHIKRELSYTKSGNKRPDIAELYEGEQLLETGKTPVDKRVKTLLGVDARQFRQIVMIAQGEFTKLLLADSKEKEKIFRNLFHTDGLKQFEDILKSHADEYKKRYEEKSVALRTMLAGLPFEIEQFTPETLSFIEEQLEVYRKEATSEQEGLKERETKKQELTKEFAYSEGLNRDIDLYDKKKQEEEDLLLKKKDYDNLGKELEQLRLANQVSLKENEVIRLKNDYDLLCDQLEEAKKQNEALALQEEDFNKELEELSQGEKRISQLDLEISKGKDELKVKKAYERSQKRLSQLRRDELHNLEQLHEHEKDLSIKEKQLEDNRKYVEQLGDYRLLLKDKDQLVSEYQNRRNMMHQLSDDYNRYNNEEEAYYELSQVYGKSLKDYDEAYQKYLEESQRFRDNQAGILARDLKEGEPCPVCGSIHHPHKAIMETRVLSIQEIESLEKRAEQLRIEKEQAFSNMSDQKEKKRVAFHDVETLKKQLHIEEELSKETFIRLLDQMTKKDIQLKKEYKDLQEEISYRENLKKTIEKDKILLEEKEKAIVQAKSDLEHLSIHIKEEESACHTSLSHYPNLLSFSEESMKEKEEERRLLSRRVVLIQEKRDQRLKDKARIHTLKETLSSQLEIKKSDLVKQKNAFEQMLNDHFERSEYDLLKKKIKDLAVMSEDYNRYMHRLELVKSSLAELEDRVKGKEKVDLSLLDEQLKTFSYEKKEKDEKAFACINAYENLKKQYVKIKKAASENEKLFDDYRRYAHLNSITSGKNSEKISFERFVLASYFEHVLEYANRELSRLTCDRFSFLRRKETKGNAGQGLDLNIIDYESGSIRDVKSLSGGESFKASLALALGLSTMIQEYAGGIELNALFIDEGFGTLDDESLDQAINVLMDMKNDKVIGIISHVSDLKERIEAGIEVKRGKHGSSLYVHY
ncbi:exonuclease SbcC [Kandleria vitulina]|uniref:Nuclease SbcCD subunit C n=1 Tax=Kandleria vitulina TaxID=1630 RepID=A0A1H2VRX6_9FIRM|nr:SMC family ATPase [Kandleria vitulina]SDW71162.1 exonuclease SbcC [Kandleria vitulina]